MTELDVCRSTFQDCCVVFYDRAHLGVGAGLLSRRQIDGRDVWAIGMVAMGKAAIKHTSANGLSLFAVPDFVGRILEDAADRPLAAIPRTTKVDAAARLDFGIAERQ